MNSYCALAFNHIYSDFGGNYRLCCHASPYNNPLEKYNSNEHLPFDVFLSREYEDVRYKMISGEMLETCNGCYHLEEIGQKSPRQNYNKNNKILLEPKNVDVKLRIFGNSCNLSCYMCTAYSSSTRAKELKDIGIHEEWNRWDQAYSVKQSPKKYDAVINNIIDNIDIIESFHITGGEPFLLPRHYDFLNQIPENYAQNISINYDTNLTHLSYKGKSIFETLKKFKKFSFSVSADHYGEKLSWIRYPINVYEFEKNLEFVQSKYNAISDISCTVSILNIEDLDEILPYYEKKFNIKNKGYHSCVEWPDMLSIKHHPNKNELIKKYTNFKMDPDKAIISHLKLERSKKQWEKAIAYLNKLDLHRQTDYRKLWRYE